MHGRSISVACFALAILIGARPSDAALADEAKLPHRHMIAAANPLAAEAGLAVLRDGGSALDAAIAAQMVLNLVEPQASGIGGGALLLYYDAASKNVSAWDGRETAPAAAGPDLFLDHDGKPLGSREARIGGRAVGVPGLLRMLETAHKVHGKLPWDRLFVYAAKLAETGTPVPRRLAAASASDAANLVHQAAAAATLLQPDRTPLPVGAVFTNRPLADTLRAVAAGGADAVLTGAVAAEIATAVRTDANPGLLTADDLAAYVPRQRTPVCGPYRDRRICGFGPPSAGGVTILQTLAFLSHFDMPALSAPPGGTWNTDAAQYLTEAARLAHADRRMYLADSDRVPVPVRGLLANDYLTVRAQLINRDHAIAVPTAGNPSWDGADHPPLSVAPPQPEHGTSDIAVIDDGGNAVSMTTSVNDVFGSRLMVRGFLLNDQLTDFSAQPERDGRPIANRVGPGKRPRSAMSPTFVFDSTGKLELVVGSAGGGDIIAYVTQAIVEMLDFNHSPQDALASPHIATTGNAALLEKDTVAASLAPALRARGQQVSIVPLDSGSVAIRVTPGGFLGGADPRRDGVAIGD